MHTKPPEDADTTATTPGTTTQEAGEKEARRDDTRAAEELAQIEREERAVIERTAAEEHERARDAVFAGVARLRERAEGLAALLDVITEHPVFVALKGAGASRFQSLVWLAHEQAERLSVEARTIVDGMGV